jgi:hypothetical protein
MAQRDCPDHIERSVEEMHREHGDYKAAECSKESVQAVASP